MNPSTPKKSWITCVFLTASLCTLLTSCSSSPSSGDGERAIQSRITEQSQGRIKLAKFQKTNGAQGELMGFKIYALEFDVEIEFTEDCKWNTGMFGQQLSFQTSKPVAQPKSSFSWNSFLDDTTNPGTLVKRGQRVKLSGVIRFMKKEKGWSIDGVELTKADVGNAPSSARAEAVPSSSPTEVVAAQPTQEMTHYEMLVKVMNDLGHIDYAKNMWALENSKRDDAMPTEDDLKPFLKGQFPVHPFGGKYVINAVIDSPASSQYGIPDHSELAHALSLARSQQPAAPRPSVDEEKKIFSINCSINLKMMGLGFRQWSLSHADRFPFNVSVRDGGTMELCSLAADGFEKDPAPHFSAMSEELSTPRILVCPADSSKQPAANFSTLSLASVTYKIHVGTNVNDSNPGEPLVRCPVHGHVLYCDGSVKRGK